MYKRLPKHAPRRKGAFTTVPESGRPYMWKKGQAPNPAGAPKSSRSLAKLLREQLDELASSSDVVRKKALALGLDPTKTSIGATLTLSMIAEALEGKGSLVREIFYRIDNFLGRGLTKTQVVRLAEEIANVINEEVLDPMTRTRIADRIGQVIARANPEIWDGLAPDAPVFDPGPGTWSEGYDDSSA